MTFKHAGVQHVLIGATSFGPKDASGPLCGINGAFNVFARISEFREWIEGKMDSPRFCDSGADAAGRRRKKKKKNVRNKKKKE